jgi:Fe-S-cluster-containing dehydrogenase component
MLGVTAYVFSCEHLNLGMCLCVSVCVTEITFNQQSGILETRHRYQAIGCRTTFPRFNPLRKFYSIFKP